MPRSAGRSIVSFEGVLGNPAAIDRLRGLIAGGRLAHAYLFAGPEGVGKRLVAISFAKGLGVEPLVVERLEDKHEVLIAQVREVIRELGFASKDRRVVIFDDADRMSEEAMNALLKTLEEPPDGTLLLLVSSAPQRLLPTIRSRCQTIFFHPLDDESIVRFLQGRMLEGPSARMAAVLACGSVGTATAMIPEIEEILTLARELQERVLAGELNPIVEALGKIRDTEKARAQARRELRILLHCLRETLLAKSGRAAALATKEFVERMSGLDDDEILEKIESLIDHERAIDLNANVSLAVEDALLRL
jgi:DNA polymerase-3 subunit delta'